MPEWSKIHEMRGFRLITIPLALLSVLYRVLVSLRLLIYKKKPGKVLPGLVVSIGNITAGGTGKTPAARLIAEWALDRGYFPAVLSRGYGGRYKEKVLVVSDGNDINTGPEEAGDEPYLLAKTLKGVPVIVSRNRHSAGLLASKRFGCNFFILDDGFQHLQLKRDLNVLLLDSVSPSGNGHLLPWGPLREPLSQINRADAVILTRFDTDLSTKGSREILKDFSHDLPMFRSSHVPERLVFPNVDETYDAEFLKGKRISAFAGIARPEAFLQTLNQLGADVAAFKGFGDHHKFTDSDIETLESLKDKAGSEYILTTEKDWVRLERNLSEWHDLAYLTIRFSILSGQENFFKIINEKISLKKGAI